MGTRPSFIVQIKMKGIFSNRALAAVLVLTGLYALSVWVSDLFVLPTLIGVLGPFLVKGSRGTQIILPAAIPFLTALLLWPWYEFEGLMIGGLVLGAYIGVVAAITAKGRSVALGANDKRKGHARSNTAER